MDYIFAIAAAIGNLGTAAGLFFLWRQSNQTQQEIDRTLRPWLGIRRVYINSNDELDVHITNHGRIAARIANVQHVVNASTITKAQVRAGNVLPSGLIIFPNTEQYILVADKMTGNRYVGLLINYQWDRNKQCVFGLIAEHDKKKPGYDPKKPELKYVEEFTD